MKSYSLDSTRLEQLPKQKQKQKQMQMQIGFAHSLQEELKE